MEKGYHLTEHIKSLPTARLDSNSQSSINDIIKKKPANCETILLIYFKEELGDRRPFNNINK